MVVHLPGRTVYVSADRIQQQADVPPTNYTLRSAAGSETDSHSGLSIRKLIALAGGNPDQLGFLRIQRPNGSFAFLTQADLADPSDFQEGPALVFMDGATAHFFRPVRSNTDVNAADNVATISGEPLVMSGHTGDLIAVKAKASPTTTHATQDVSFSATVSGPHANDQLKYSWHFDDGTVGHGPNPTHAFALEGGYNVFVTVAGAGDSGGASDTIHITVGKKPPERQRRPVGRRQHGRERSGRRARCRAGAGATAGAASRRRRGLHHAVHPALHEHAAADHQQHAPGPARAAHQHPEGRARHARGQRHPAGVFSTGGDR